MHCHATRDDLQRGNLLVSFYVPVVVVEWSVVDGKTQRRQLTITQCSNECNLPIEPVQMIIIINGRSDADLLYLIVTQWQMQYVKEITILYIHFLIGGI